MIIFIEIIKWKKFGCYITSEIKELNNYIIDPNTFIFKIDVENKTLVKYPIKEKEYVIKIKYENDDYLFIVWYNWNSFNSNVDIVIKKRGIYYDY